ncbi:hypothetical protein QBC36DRAFT_295852 [Triangularia setosa]|uniref:Uncharacterized protein n=1 Tax=Triangularia setosa TaxID=2587417 RepID=A0AAN7A3E0_9PEZI|nr:hypothetical protein QBC36DRAFT_295852 [Podospora setosa]
MGNCNGGDRNKQIAGIWSMEHEDPRGCVIYMVTAFCKTRKLLDEEEQGVDRVGGLNIKIREWRSNQGYKNVKGSRDI